MKIYVHSFLLLFFLFSVRVCAENNKEKLPIKVKVNLSERFAQEPQWVYLFSLYDNETNIEDSLYLQPGQTLFCFDQRFNNERDEYNAWLTFEKNGPRQAMMKLIPGDQVIIYIDEHTKPYYPRVEGSLFCEEKYHNRMLIDSIKNIVQYLTDSIVLTKDRQKIFELEQQIERHKKYINRDSYFEFFEKAKDPLTAYSMLDIIYFKYPNEENLNKMIENMKRRFPHNKKIQAFPNLTSAPPASKRSKWATARFEQIISIRTQEISSLKNTSPIDKKMLEQIKPYQMGNRVDSISLIGLKGDAISLNDINTGYILIDFWAGWCAPCRKEIPYLKRVAEKYPHQITILAISFDNSEKEWRNTIEIDKSELFTHLYSGLITSPESSLLCARFGIKAIPANFLLDKNRKIIAVDLREDALMKKMEELKYFTD